MSYLLDTSAWKTLALGGTLAPKAAILAHPDTELFLLDISFWEICKAVEKRTLVLDRPPLEWIEQALTDNITVLSTTPEVADTSCKLFDEGLETEDPADQMICAAARTHRLTLVTRDRKIERWGKIPVLRY